MCQLSPPCQVARVWALVKVHPAGAYFRNIRSEFAGAKLLVLVRLATKLRNLQQWNRFFGIAIGERVGVFENVFVVPCTIELSRSV
jgi:hypothetical protein